MIQTLPMRAASTDRNTSVANLLRAWSDGDSRAFGHLMPLLFGDLRRMAEHLLTRESADPMLQAEALVNELYLQFQERRKVTWRDPEHFRAIAMTEMRRILMTHGRRKRAAKRGSGQSQAPLSEATEIGVDRSDRVIDALAVGTLLQRLEGLDTEARKVVEQRFYFGLSVGEIAQRLGTTERTVYRRWAFAKAWLHDQLATAS
ncbi:MAG: ECF-type sigma factor [Acidobacteriota bacterium]